MENLSPVFIEIFSKAAVSPLSITQIYPRAAHMQRSIADDTHIVSIYSRYWHLRPPWIFHHITSFCWKVSYTARYTMYIFIFYLHCTKFVHLIEYGTVYTRSQVWLQRVFSTLKREKGKANPFPSDLSLRRSNKFSWYDSVSRLVSPPWGKH